jgi:hypothetical protein
MKKLHLSLLNLKNINQSKGKKMENINIKIRKISFILIVATLLTLLVGCSSTSDSGDDIEAPDGTVGVTNDAVHFTVCYPQNWICDRNDGMIAMSPPGDSESKASVSVHESSALSEATTAAEYWEKAKEELKASGNECNFIESKERKLGDADAVEAVYGMTVGGKTYKVTQIFAYKYIDKSHRVFTITFTGTEADYSNVEIVDSFRTIVNCFAFKGK